MTAEPATAESETLDHLRETILSATLPNVLFGGWTRKALIAGAEAEHLTADDVDLVFPRGVKDATRVEELTEAAAQQKRRTPSAVRQLLEGWRAKYFRRVTNADFYERVMPILLSKAVQLRRSFNQRKGSMQGMVWVKNVILLMLENTYDLYLCFHYWVFGYDDYSAGLGGILAFSAVVLALSARFYTREGPHAALAALVGLKVFVEVQRAIKDEAPGRLLR